MTVNSSGAATLVQGFGALLADLDGVVYAGPAAIPGAIDALEGLAGAGVALAYITNNASRSSAEVAAHLRELGAPAEARQVYGSALAGAELLAGIVPRGASVLVTGSAILAQHVAEQGLVPVSTADPLPDAVIQGFEPTLGWKDLAEAAFAVAGGAVWVATNTDMSIPQARGIAPGNGTLVAAVSAATGKQPLVAGKPEAQLFRTAASHLGVNMALVVGDRLDTDILGGNRAGLATALVLTGVDTVESALAAVSDQRPTYLLGNLGELHKPYPVIHEELGIFTCGESSAQVRDGVVIMDGERDSVDTWRAACAAWWTSKPHQDRALFPPLEFVREPSKTY
ncbi:HAD superfamily hydrolase (TIGR01450 family) [Arthrobacter pigmenti]|uniref:HAD superfamily hydrolase (TIGR01450 family) n=1 Tax=Arthrobacter pigmenti TaxID=271432 RepID=A0A846RN16_9MICC|nr:HAD superfamily hydrolase (TIGR01450 family) [Arthrobacter pigmenti]